MSEPTHIFFGEPVTPIAAPHIIRWGIMAAVFGWLAGMIGLDPALMAITLFTSGCLSSMGFPMGVKYMVLCVGTAFAVVYLGRVLF